MQPDVLVIGAGISGLSFAYRCAQAGRRVTVLDARAHAGGCLHSLRDPSGFWMELGAHTMYATYGGVIELMEQTGLREKLRPRTPVPFRVRVDGEIRPIRPELRMLELMVRLPRAFFLKKTGCTVREYYARIVGPKNYARVFHRMFAAVPSQDADDFPADTLFKRRRSHAGVPKSFTFDGGVGTLIDALAAHERITVITGAEAEAVLPGGVVRTRDGQLHQAAQVAIATPPAIAASLVREHSPALAGAIGAIASTTLETTGVILAASATPVERVAGIIPLDGAFFSAVSRDPVPDAARRGFAFHFPPGTGEAERLAQICRTLRVEAGALASVVTHTETLPTLRLGHGARVAAIEDAVRRTPLFLCGNYFAGLSIEDCVSRSFAEAERLLQPPKLLS